MHNLVFDLGRGLLIAGALFVFLFGLLVLALVVSIKEAWEKREADLDRMDRLVKRDRARAAETAVYRPKPQIPRPDRLR